MNMCMHIYLDEYACMEVFIHRCIGTIHVHIRIIMHVYMHEFACIYTDTGEYACIYVYLGEYARMYTYIYG
jgi:hypothetical protein